MEASKSRVDGTLQIPAAHHTETSIEGTDISRSVAMEHRSSRSVLARGLGIYGHHSDEVCVFGLFGGFLTRLLAEANLGL
jgi:hypothetical protein